jgi:outer membrane lipoprotein-sorting protein
MITRTGLVWLAGIVLGCGAAALGDDVDTVEKKIENAWDKSKSLTAKMTLSSRLTVGDSLITATGEGTYDFLHQDGKLLSRTEFRSSTLQKTATEENRFDQHVLAVSDGRTSQTLVETTGGEPRIVKSKVDPQQTGDPKALLESLRRQGAVAVLPDDLVDGRKVYVIEVILREVEPFSSGKQRFSFDQESGFLVRIVGLGDDDLPMSTVTYSDIKIDVPIPLERFTLKIPEGVEVVDETKPESQPTTASRPASRPATAPASQPVGPRRP